MDELHCSIVVMNGSKPKVLRLNLGCSDEFQTPFLSASSSPCADIGRLQGHRLNPSTPVSSPEEEGATSNTKSSVNSASSSEVTSLFLVYEQNPLYEGPRPPRREHIPISESNDFYDHKPLLDVELEKERALTLRKPPISSMPHVTIDKRINQRTKSPTSKTLLESFAHCDQESETNGLELEQAQSRKYVLNSGIKDTIPVGRTSSVPPPLCSHCQNKAPVFGKPPRRFSYEEIEEATDMFSDVNFLAEGGFGVVHRGVLRDGQVVAVKQLKFSGTQADLDFCREVRVLSCAQHRNVVLLIGFCIEENSRILVYEYICNGSLELYLHGLHLALLLFPDPILNVQIKYQTNFFYVLYIDRKQERCFRLELALKDSNWSCTRLTLPS